MNANEYRKRKSQNTSFGFDFQQDWSLLYILRAHDLHCNGLIEDYKIACEMDTLGDFDDLALTLLGHENQPKHILFQFKQKSGATTLFGMLELENKKGDFSVTTYFKSYQDIKQNLKYAIEDVTLLVLHTNIDMHEEAKKCFVEVVEELDSILLPPTGTAKYLRLKDECIGSFLKCSSKENERKEFVKRFLIAINQPNNKSQIFYQFKGLTPEKLNIMLEEVKIWINNKKSVIFINSNRFKTIREKSMKGIEDFQFEKNDEENVSDNIIQELRNFLSNTNTKAMDIYYSMSNKASYLRALYDCLKDTNKHLIYVSNYEDLDCRKDIFWLARGEVLIVDCGTTIRWKDKEQFCNVCWKVIILLENYELENRFLVQQTSHINKSLQSTKTIGIHTLRKDFEGCSKKLSLLVETGTNEKNCVRRFKGNFKYLDENLENTNFFSNSCTKCLSKNFADEDIFIISDVSGSGKSTFLKILFNKFRSSETFHYYKVRHINSASNVNLKLLQKEENKYLIILCDILDEIEGEQEQLKFLENIRSQYEKCQSAKIFITCSPEIKETVESFFGIFCWSFQPLTASDQEKILKKCCEINVDFQKVINDINCSRICDVMQNIMHFKLFASEIQNFYDLGKSYEEMLGCHGLPELYNLIIDAKINNWLKNKVKIRPESFLDRTKQELMEDLENLAFHILFKEKLPKQIVLNKFSSGFGITTIDTKKKNNFIHRAFADFFAARKIVTSGLKTKWLKKIFVIPFEVLLILQLNNLSEKWNFLRKCLDFYLLKNQSNVCKNLKDMLGTQVFCELENIYGLSYWIEYPNLFSFALNCLEVEQLKIWKSVLGWTDLMIYSFQNKSHLVVKELKSNSKELNDVNNHGQSAIYLASFQGYLNIVKILAEHENCHFDRSCNSKFQINSEYRISNRTIFNQKFSTRTKTPLMTSVRKGHIEIVKFLIDKGANVDKELDLDNSPVINITVLFEAVFQGNVEMVQLLINSGANINEKLGDGSTPLHISTFYNQYKIVEILVRNANCCIDERNSDGDTALSIASGLGFMEIAKLLIQHKSNIYTKNLEELTPLGLCSYLGHHLVVKLFIDIGADLTIKNVHNSTALHLASQINHLAVVKILLEKDVSLLEQCDSFNRTALMVAVVSNQIQVVKYLIIKKANINHQDMNGSSILMYACDDGKQEIFEYFLANGADVSIKNNQGFHVLHLAADMNHFEVLKILLSNGNLNADEIDNNGRTPFHYAISRSHIEVAKYLLQQGANINHKAKDGSTALINSIISGNDLIEFFMHYRVNANIMDKEGLTAFHYAVKYNFLKSIKFLIEKNYFNVDDTTRDDWTPLMIAIVSGHIELFNFLLTKGANINHRTCDGKTPIIIAVLKNQVIIVELLIKKKADLNMKRIDGYTALHLAVELNHSEIVEKLVKTGKCKLDETNDKGCTPLMIAVSSNYFKIVRILLNYRVNVNIKRAIDGMTVLQTAVCVNNCNVVKLLIEKGCKIDDTDHQNQTALIIASSYGHTKLVRFLIGKGADTETKMVGGYTALYVAVQKNHFDVAKFLIELGKCDVSEKADDASTPLSVAICQGNDAMVQLLMDSGASST